MPLPPPTLVNSSFPYIRSAHQATQPNTNPGCPPPGPAEAEEGRDGAPPRRLGSPSAAARLCSPCSHGPAPRARAPRLLADTPPPHARPRPSRSASSAPGRPEAAALPPDAAAGRARGGGVAGSAANRGAAAYKASPHWLFGQGAGLGAGGLPERPGGRSVGRPGCGTDPLAVGSRRAPQRGVRPASRRAW